MDRSNRTRMLPGLAIAMVALGGPAGWALADTANRAQVRHGTDGADVLHGSPAQDRIYGGRGADRLFGGRGDDRLQGGGGADRLRGGAGADILVGGSGRDRLFGGRGADRIDAGAGNDRIFSGSGGHDRIDCGPGRDVVYTDSEHRPAGCEQVRPPLRDSRHRGKRGRGREETDESDEDDEDEGAGSVPGDSPPDDSTPPDDPEPGKPGVIPFEPHGPVTGESPTKPNIVLVLTDDQRFDTITPEYMPNVWSLLVEQGMSFTNAYVTVSLCCPSRASIMTGQHAHNHGVLSNSPPNGGVTAFNEDSTLATWLTAAGYRTALVGKYLNGYGIDDDGGGPHGPLYKPPGWDTFYAFSDGKRFQGPAYYDYYLNLNGNQLKFYDEGPDHYSTYLLRDKMFDFLDRTEADDDSQPFFIYYSPYAPHSPSTPAPEDEACLEGPDPDKCLFADVRPICPDTPKEGDFCPPSFNEQDVSDKPAWVQEKGEIDSDKKEKISKHRVAQLRSAYAVDRTVGDLVAKLEALGELDDTMIVLLSDNGYLWGEHRVQRKYNAYQEAIRTPMVIRGPGVAPNTTSNEIVANIDLAPTFAEIAGATPTLTVDGRSLVPLLKDEQIDLRDDMLFEHWAEPNNEGPEVPTYKALYTEVFGHPYKYVEYHGSDDQPPTERELYDLETDPDEMESLDDDAGAQPLIKQLSARLAELGSCAGVSCW